MHTGDQELKLKAFGDYLYDNIVLFAASTDDFVTITLGDLVDFINDGGNLLLATSPFASDGIRLFAESIGVVFDSYKSMVVDHFNYLPSADER
jgi:oligosaccharyltransferase complex subunit beta